MASSQAQLQLALRHFRRALSRWPEDKLRPDVSFAKTILEAKQARLAPGSLPAPVSPVARRPKEVSGNSTDASAATPSTASSSAAPPVISTEVDSVAELEQANALYSLLENRYASAFKLSPKMSTPAGAPEHYSRILEEIQAAPNRSWLGRVVKRWSGIIRWK